MSLDSRWLQFAQEDLKIAALGMDVAIWNQACFHSQQAAEKLLKANLAGAPPKTHKLAD